MKNVKLNWKKKTLDTENAYWYSAKVPIVDWEYIVDVYDQYSKAYLFLGPNQDEINLFPKKKFKKIETAKHECEKHLSKTYEKLKKWIESNSHEK
jgi:hypothetical protein